MLSGSSRYSPRRCLRISSDFENHHIPPYQGRARRQRAIEPDITIPVDDVNNLVTVYNIRMSFLLLLCTVVCTGVCAWVGQAGLMQVCVCVCACVGGCVRA